LTIRVVLMIFDPATLRTLINQHGVTVTIRKRVNGTYDPVSGTLVQSNTDYTARAYFFNSDPSVLPFNQANARYDNIISTEKRVVVSDKLTNGNNTPEIDATDQVLYDGKEYQVTRTTDISSGASKMCQMLYVSE
jgi:hypothetical protein